MFLLPTYVAASSVHGMGAFTPLPIAQGARLWEFNPAVDWTITPGELAAIPERLRLRLRTYCFLNPNGVYVLCGDNARFMNHQDDPNCDDTRPGLTIARRDIQAHEELTCDYRVFDLE
jgi:SET domain-containing protein